MSDTIRIGFRFKCRQCGEVYRANEHDFPVSENETLTSTLQEISGTMGSTKFVHDCSHGAGKLVGIAVFVGMELIEG